MQPHKEDVNADCCNICGAAGWKETLLTCCKCKEIREHAYCMKYHTFKIPKYWICESCKSKSVATSPRKEDQGIEARVSQNHQTGKTKKVRFSDEVIRLSSGPASCTSLTIGKAAFVGSSSSVIPYSNPPVSSSKVLGKHPRNDEIHKKPMTSKHASCSLSKGSTKEYPGENQQPRARVIADKGVQFYFDAFEALSTIRSPFEDSEPPKKCLGKNQRPISGVTPAKKVQIHDPQKEKPTKTAPFVALSARKSAPIVGSGGTPCAHDQIIQQNLNRDCKFSPSSIATWRGQFRIFHSAATSKLYDGIEAQPPFVVSRKAYKFSREMPSVLQLESHPALNVLTDIFGDDSPKLHDIALYFFPSEQTERSRKDLNSILKFMNAEKSMLRSDINGVELLIFTSNQLGMDSRGAIAAVKGGHFLWGLFRKKKIDKTIERVPDMEPVAMHFDMPGGEDAIGLKEYLSLVTPNLEFDNNHLELFTPKLDNNHLELFTPKLDNNHLELFTPKLDNNHLALVTPKLEFDDNHLALVTPKLEFDDNHLALVPKLEFDNNHLPVITPKMLFDNALDVPPGFKRLPRRPS